MQNWGNLLIFGYCKLKGRAESAKSCIPELFFLAFYSAFNAILKRISVWGSRFQKNFQQLDGRNRAGAMGKPQFWSTSHALRSRFF